MISVAIVEDNSTESENLYSLLKLYGDDVGVEIKITKFDNGFKFLDGYKAVYDVVFLDIEMPDMDGMTVARKLREFDRSIFVVFVTNIAKYAIHGYEVDALDYFLKPARYHDIKMRMETVRKQKAVFDFSILIPFQGGIKKLSVNEIIYIESRAHDITFHTESGDFINRGATLKQYENDLTAHGFFRCNTCYIVNLKYCTAVNESMVRCGKEELQISRARKKDFMRAILRSMGG